jgi:jumonji domain-containing protein 7
LALKSRSWYPAEIHAERYAYERFSRRVARMAGMNGVILPPGDEEEEAEADADVGDVWGSEGSGEEWDPREWGR